MKDGDVPIPVPSSDRGCFVLVRVLKWLIVGDGLYGRFEVDDWANLLRIVFVGVFFA
jgi:hypothetical protein